ncbi:hypothetical protein [Thermomonospora umbrina]|uniref:Uncharacterized protein n=1 Tax=Thermomonospora umbrina TaxID=111806 RepID=A0A3D9T604_9ACTN|nr:hypothetical protein [Thermomonospora umbrina]REF00676.1 hypothetical protein DFJ69_6233 [Thermomonospora umbrina]
MNPPQPREERHADAVSVDVAFLLAVIAVYGPWTTSRAVNGPERRLAVWRVDLARRELDRLSPLRRRTNGTWA